MLIYLRVLTGKEQNASTQWSQTSKQHLYSVSGVGKN